MVGDSAELHSDWCTGDAGAWKEEGGGMWGLSRAKEVKNYKKQQGSSVHVKPIWIC